MNPRHRSGRIGLARRSNGPRNGPRNGPVNGPVNGRRRAAGLVPPGVELAAQWAWRFLVVTAAIAVCVYLVASLSEIVIPVLVALLVCALISPPVQFLRRHRWPKVLAILAVLVGLLLIVGGLALLVTTQIRSGLPQLEARGPSRGTTASAHTCGSDLSI